MSKEESPLQSIVDKMSMRINETNVTTTKLSKIIQLAVELRDGLFEDGVLPEHQWWVDKHKKDLAEIIERANNIAQTIFKGKEDISQ